MARLANGAVHLYQRLQELYPHKMLLTTQQSEQSSPFRRWTTGNGAASTYRHHDHRNIYSKQMSEGCAVAGGAAGCGGGSVARWSLGLEHLLADPVGAAAFAHFLHKEFAVENIRFWWACEQYAKCEDVGRRVSLTQEIWQRHLAEGAPEPVNVDAAARRSTALRLHLDPPPLDLFQQAQKQIFNVMKFDSYPRFLRSPEHSECARADLRGLPPPYAPAAEPGPETSPKLKKSASNASDRRRSGGALLLPWRHRGVSRDREERAPRTPTPPAPPVNDLKSVPILPNLCRVKLPDKTTSVIEVDEKQTVKCALDQLLQKRNLVCSSYDVIVCDDTQCELNVDLSSPSGVLGGREARVERRCVLRLELGARCVSVRARPPRRLRHVLRLVLAKYAPHANPQQHNVYAADGTPVSVDTPILELDGARLRVVKAIEDSECGGDGERPEDSLSELAFRIQEDSLRDLDAQSGVSGSSAGRSECGSSCGAGFGAEGASGAGRVVRAALRNGPPLHLHPGFVDDLRETQRIRLQRAEPVPSPRSPPPLPPKPAPRQTPTLV